MAVLETWGDFEAGVQVDTDAPWMVEGADTLCIFRTDASTQ